MITNERQEIIESMLTEKMRPNNCVVLLRSEIGRGNSGVRKANPFSRFREPRPTEFKPATRCNNRILVYEASQCG